MGRKRMNWKMWSILAVLITGLIFFGTGQAQAQSNPPPVQTFYVPFPESQLLQGLQAIESGGSGNAPASPVTTYISLAAIADGTIIYYDQWENGYDPDIANPGNLYSASNPGGTQIWGDGNPANGAPPGVASDLIDAGTVIILNNAVNTSTPLVIDFDGRDKIAATKNIAVTRSGWASGSNTLLAGAVEVYDTLNWGTLYRVPVGENIPDTTDYQMFEYTGLYIMAGEGGATISVDANADGDYTDLGDVNNVTLAEGETRFVDGGVNVGARVVSNNPVQVDILTGDRASSYESRDSALLPVSMWSSSYYTPVSTPATVTWGGNTYTSGTTVWLYNPGGSAITVNYAWFGGSSSINVNAGSYAKVVLANQTGYHFYTSGAPFYAFSTTDSTSSTFSNNQAWDWGFSLIPQESLTPQVLVGLGIGRDPTSGTNPSENGNPLWVTPIGNGTTAVTVYIDYDADPTTGTLIDPNGNHYDTSVSLQELQRAKIYDTTDRNQTGMLVYVLASGVKLAAAWGQDPLTASPGAPGLDVGTSVPPTPLFSTGKNGTLYEDNDGDGFITHGDELEYTIVINNISRAPVPDVILHDNIPANTSYVPNSTYNGAVQIPDSGTTAFPLDEGGVNVGTIPVGGSITVTFRVIIVNPVPAGTTEILNTGSAVAVGITVPFEDTTPLGGIGDFVWNDVDMDGIQDAGETGIPGVVVNLYVSDGTTLIATATTDAYGYYSFTGLNSGSYIVEFVKPAGYDASLADQGGNDALDSDASTITGRTAVFTWTAGQTITTIDAGFWMPTPLIDIQKTPDSQTVIQGETAIFTIVVTKTGNVALTNVSVSDPLAPNCAATIGNLSAVAPNNTYTYSCSLANVTAGFTNVATVTGSYGTTTVTDTDNALVTVIHPAIDIQKTPDTQTVIYGSTANFTIVVTNTGDVPLTNVAVTDPLAPNCAATIGNLSAVGPNNTYTYTCSLANVTAGFTNVATVTGSYGTTTVTDNDDAAVVVDILPDISVTKTANPTAVPETGGNVVFTFVVKNTSTEEPVTILSLIDSVYGTLAGDADCQVGTVLAAGDSCSFSFTEWVEGDYSGADHVNVFTAVAEDNDGTDATDDDDATVDFSNVLPTIEVTKTANPTAVPETGGNVVFTFVVKNTSTEEPVTILSLVDSVYGTLAGDADCQVGTVLAAGDSCSFSFTEWVEGDYSGPDHINVFTAKAVDNDNTEATDTDDATVDFSNVPPAIDVTKTANPTAVPETGGNVTFTFVVKNTSSEEPVTITSLSDSVYGTLAGDDDCKVGTVLAAGASCEFSFTKWVEGDYSGPDHINVFTAKAVDNDNTEATDTDDATVDFSNVPPAIDVTKTANPTAVPETGGNVTFTFVVKNTSTEEPVTITSLSDSVYGTLAGDDDCKVGTVLAAGASCEFSFTKWVEGDYSGPDHVNVFTAKAVDDDNTEATDTDDATVDFSNVPPAIDVTKTANPTAVPETGGNVTFTFVVKNTSTEEPVTILSLVDSVYGTLAGDADCQVGTVLAAGDSCSFSFTEWVEGDYETASVHTNVFTVHAEDNDKTDCSDGDDATVTLTNLTADIAIVKVTVDGATSGDGLSILTGEPITWKYTVSNTGDVALSNVTVTDSQGVSVTCPNTTLAVGESMECTASGAVITGSYSNSGTASGSFTDGAGNIESAAATDDSSYFGANPQVAINKTTNGADGLTILVGQAVTWTYVVTNTGNIALTNVLVSDDKLGAITCPKTTLAVGESMTCTALGTAVAGPYINTGTATGSYTDSAGHSRTDTATDPSSYFGANPSFTVAKACKADTEPIPQEGPALFTVTFSNDGNVPLSITADDGIGTFTLAVGEEKSFNVSVDGPFSGFATADNTVNASATYTDSAGTPKTITHDASASCRVGSRDNVLKWTQGAVNPGQTWTFSNWAGADGFGKTQLSSSNTYGDSDGLLDFSNFNLDRLQTYTICEESIPAGWTSFWQVDTNNDGVADTTVIPYNPNSDDPVPQDLGNRCVDFGAGTGVNLLTDGGTVLFQVNNTYPGGEPRTPGYWKNWNRCTGGGQDENAEVELGCQ